MEIIKGKIYYSIIDLSEITNTKESKVRDVFSTYGIVRKKSTEDKRALYDKKQLKLLKALLSISVRNSFIIKTDIEYNSKLNDMKKEFVEGRDYYLEEGRVHLTKEYLEEKKSCCGLSDCRHCPYNEKVKGNTILRENK